MGTWDSYYVVFLSAVLSLAIPAFLATVSYFLFRKTPTRSAKRPQPPSGETILGQNINVRFFLATNAALVLFALALELIPCVLTIQGASFGEGALRGIIAIISIAGFSVLGLLYSVRKGDMSWVHSIRKKG